MSKDKRNKQAPELSRTLALLQTLVNILAIGLGVTVAVGLRGVLADEGGFTSWLVPIIFAAILTAVMAGLWHVTLKMAATVNPQDPKQLWTVIAFALALTAVHGATSMPFLASAIGGADAVRHHQERTLAQLSVAADTIQANAEARSTVRAGLASQTEVLRRLLDQEITGSGPSGTSGFGPIATQIQAALNALIRSGERFDGNSGMLLSQIAVVRDNIAAARDASLMGDEQTFIERIGASRAILSSAVREVGGQVSSAYDFGSSPIAQVRTVGERIARLQLAGGIGSERVVLPVYQPVSRPEAVQRYPEVVPLAWSVAAAVDILGLIAVAAIMLLRHQIAK